MPMGPGTYGSKKGRPPKKKMGSKPMYANKGTMSKAAKMKALRAKKKK